MSGDNARLRLTNKLHSIVSGAGCAGALAVKGRQQNRAIHAYAAQADAETAPPAGSRHITPPHMTRC